MVQKQNLPIGVFDSGLGGLTVVKQMKILLPNEDIIYFGDTGRVPYGSRSREIIRKYAAQDVNFLKSMGIKMLIAACGTVSSVASDICSSDPSLLYSGVVDPACEEALAVTKNGKIGVIATGASVRSNSYKNKLEDFTKNIEVFQEACPMLVSLVENGFIGESDPVPYLVASRYLQPMIEAKVDTLILGCTHFPILAPIIKKIMGDSVTLIDTGKEAAKWAKRTLEENCLQNDYNNNCSHRFFVSDHCDDFSKIGGMFLGENLNGTVEQVDIDKIEY